MAAAMEWASLDSFFVPDAFWQDKMGKPIANRDFLHALLRHGDFPRYRFFYLDDAELAAARARLGEALPPAAVARLDLAPHAALMATLNEAPIDVFHQGDFTFHAPSLAELRHRLPPERAFAISGVTHSLDGVNIHGRLLQILLAGPQPYDAIICTSACAKRMVEAAFNAIRAAFEARVGAALPEPPPLVQIPLGLPEDAASGGEPATDLPAGKLILLGLGRFSARRKTDLAPLLECLQHLHATKALPPFHLVLAGGGTDADIALAAGLVETLGLGEVVSLEPNITPARKNALLAASDIFVSLVDNHQETFGLSILEAMAHGLPTVVTDFDGYRELVDDETGFRVPTMASAEPEPWDSLAGLLDPSILAFQRSQKVAFDFRAVARALGALAGDSDLRKRMGAAGRKRSADYRWSALIPRYEALWREQRERLAHARSTGAAGGNAPPPLLLSPPFDAVFGHYASKTLTDATRLAVSDYARARTAQGFTPIIYEGLKRHLAFPVMQTLMAQLDASPNSLGETVAAVCVAHDVDRTAVMLNLDFLVKHGYVETVENG